MNDYPMTEQANRDPRRQGMTLIEALIILAAIAIVVVISVPGSTMVLEHYRLKSTSGELLDGLNLAREQALRHDGTVRICPTANGHQCRNDGNWDQGWLVFEDQNGDGSVQDAELMQAFRAPTEHVHIIATGAVANMASFSLNGLLEQGHYETGQFHVCHDGLASRGKTIQIDNDGWVRAFPIEKGLSVCKRS
jgi:type IV fimbrial biogenesis protein FimT